VRHDLGAAGMVIGAWSAAGRIARSTRLAAFWLSVTVYILWSALMVYFAFFGHPS
jgi:hypothetical protein